jgi:hypothetical protein
MHSSAVFAVHILPEGVGTLNAEMHATVDLA